MKSNTQKILVQLFENGLYSLDKYGNVYSFKNSRHGLRKFGKRLRIRLDECGYPRVHFSHKEYNLAPRVHQIMWLYYNGFYDEMFQINHKDGDKQNNKLNNLELVTKSENVKHAFKLKLKVNRKGDRHPQTRLSDSQLCWVREQKALNTMSQKQMAIICGVSQSLISQVLRGTHRGEKSL